MRAPTRPVYPLIALIAALAFIGIINHSRIERVDALTAAGGESLSADPKSPTGYAGGVRSLLVSDHDTDSYQWLEQTELGIARDEWRVRRVNYDNAPFGRIVLTPSPYRWWLSFLAHCDHFVSGRSLPLSVEHVARYADPVLEALLLILGAGLVWRYFGGFAATLSALLLPCLFPLGAWFTGGSPTDRGLALMAAWLSLLPLGLGLQFRQPTSGADGKPPAPDRASPIFLLAGILAGIALWLRPAPGVILIVGVAAGAVLLAWSQRPRTSSATNSFAASQPHTTAAAPWLLWALGGAATVLIAYFIEYFPDNMTGWKLDHLHPLYGVAWVGVGILLTWLTRMLEPSRRSWRWGSVTVLGIGLVAVAVPIAVAHRTGSIAALLAELAVQRSHLPDARGAENVWAWIARAGVTSALAAILFPVLTVVLAGWSLARHRGEARNPALLVLLIPTIVFVVLACAHVYWWNACEAVALGLFVVTVANDSHSATAKWVWFAGTLAMAAPGAVALASDAGIGVPAAFSEADVVALVERDVSHWLANRVGAKGAVVLAPPNLSTSLYFHGGLQVLDTPYWENKEGMNAAVRLASASSPDEGLALARRRGVTHVLLPSWDPALDEIVRSSSNQPDKTILGFLRQWRAPRWLRPVPYPMPAIPGFEGQSVAVFEVVDVQDNAVALSRLAEYFVEMQRLEDAARVAVTLEKAFPSDLGATVARAAVAHAYQDPDRMSEAMQVLTRPQSAEAAAGLPWDLKVSYAIALAQGQRLDLAKKEMEQCLTDVTEEHLRFLTPQSLYRFQLLVKACQLEIADPQLRALARALLPPEIRGKV